MCDLQGPKIRLGEMEAPFQIATGDTIRVTSTPVLGNRTRMTIVYPDIHKDLASGDKIFINDGTVQLSVTKVDGKDLICHVGPDSLAYVTTLLTAYSEG